MLDLDKTHNEMIDCILDTDTYNEIDDQFAIAYMLKNSDKINVKGITIAPFLNFKSSTVPLSIEKSYNEAQKIVKLCNREDISNIIIKGSRSFLKDEKTYVESEACDFIINESLKYNSEKRLYIIAIGAITNVASAILKDESIIDRITVVWLGGNSYDFYNNNCPEFNLMGDIAAARVVMTKCKSFVQLPCMGVVSEFKTTRYELEHFLLGKGDLADYLCKNVIEYRNETSKNPAWSKVIWDVCAIAYLINKDERFMVVRERNVKIPSLEDGSYKETLDRKIKYVEYIKRDSLMIDLFRKLAS